MQKKKRRQNTIFKFSNYEVIVTIILAMKIKIWRKFFCAKRNCFFMHPVTVSQYFFVFGIILPGYLDFFFIYCFLKWDKIFVSGRTICMKWALPWRTVLMLVKKELWYEIRRKCFWLGGIVVKKMDIKGELIQKITWNISDFFHRSLVPLPTSMALSNVSLLIRVGNWFGRR